MKTILFKFLTVFTLLYIFSGYSVAADDCFRCIVKNEYHLTDDGQLVKPERYYYLNSSFSVDKATGKIVGGVLNNTGDYKKSVIDNGSFKVFSFSKERGVAETLAIKSQQEGKKKPFVGIDYLQIVVTGVCE